MAPVSSAPAPVVGPDDLLLTRALHFARTTPDRTWLFQPVGDGVVEEYSWSRALDEARRLAAWLRTLDLPPGSAIAMLAKNSAHFPIFELAIWMAGHVTVALYPTLTAHSVQQILEHSGAKLCFVGKLDGWSSMKGGIPASLPTFACKLSPADARERFPLWEDLVAHHLPITDDPRPDPDALAVIMYTSGSTGTPKGVMHSHRTMATPPIGYAKEFRLGAHHRLFSYLPLSHTLERTLVMATSMAHGASMYFNQSLETFNADLKKARPTLFFSIPRLWLRFQAAVYEKQPKAKLDRLLRIPIVRGIVGKRVLEQLGLDSVQMAFTTSAPLPADVIAWFESLGLTMIEGFGMTEDFGYSHRSTPGHTKAGWVGEPAPGVTSRIGDNGELQVKTPTAMLGYFNAPELDAEAFTTDRYLRTGDRGEFDAMGRLRLTGRVKELFKTSKGKYVAPAPIENALNGSGLVEQSCVMGEGQGQPFAVVMLNAVARAETRSAEGRAALVARLRKVRDTVNAALDPHERLQLLAVAREEWTIGAGLLTPTMKIKRAAIEARYRAFMDRWYGNKDAVQFEE
ncbi:MAG: AMP-binding protein [Gemmatimonadaceae bacterium]|jgi:long-subunit acyl-CoA synthetase (AMP-forming)|nr:AMP-binding protein [Gemmatimonadaceae bacterium]